LNCQPLPWDLGISPPSSGSLGSSRTKTFSYWLYNSCFQYTIGWKVNPIITITVGVKRTTWKIHRETHRPAHSHMHPPKLKGIHTSTRYKIPHIPNLVYKKLDNQQTLVTTPSWIPTTPRKGRQCTTSTMVYYDQSKENGHAFTSMHEHWSCFFFSFLILFQLTTRSS
jgi:hypothetical protein